MNQQASQVPINYLDQISAAPPKKPFFSLSLRTVIIGAILVVIVIIITSIVIGSINSGQKEPWQRLSVKLSVTTDVANDSTKLIKSSALRSLNSDLKLYLTNTNRDIAKILIKAGVETAKIPASITKDEKGTGISDRLEDARLNAKYDSTYAREMSYQLSTLLSLYQKLYSSSHSSETKTFLKSAYDNLLPTQQAIAEFSSSTE